MNVKTNLFEDYVNFVDLTKKQNKRYKRIIVLFMVIISLFLILLLFRYLYE